MSDLLQSVLEGLREPADALLDPGKRVFWPSLLGAAAIAAVLLLGRGAAVRRLPLLLLSRRIWLHRSARADYQLLVAKALLRVALLGTLGVSTLAVAAGVAGWLRQHLGAPGLGHGASPLLLGAVFTICAFLADDWSRFFVHRLMHRVPLLWEFHKVHHSAEVLTPFTLYRTHPVESLLNGARGAAAVGLVTGVFGWIFGPGLRVWEVLGVEAIGFFWTLLGANLRHSHVWVSYGRRLEHLLVSPAQHQLHHSRDPRHFDRNFGTILAVWDWLGGSLVTTGAAPAVPLRFGLPADEALRHRGVFDLLLEPFMASGALLAQKVLRPQRRRLSGAATAGLLGLCLLSLGCTSKRLDRAVLLQSLGQCTLDSYRGAATAAQQLAQATSALAQDPSPAARTAAQAAWAQAIDGWQVAELLRYGPAADFETLGGKGLREEIYSWPDVNRCLIEEQLVSRAYEGGGIMTLSTSTRGLAALEYLLFYAGTDNACSPTAAINTDGSWAALSADELVRRKAAYASAAAGTVAAKTAALVAAWEPSGFLSQLATAGRGSTLFPTQQDAISATAEAMFFLDTEVKDRKLAGPLGLTLPGCGAMVCPQSRESLWAERGKRNLQNNLAGLRGLLVGCAAGMGLGYDDLLEAVGAGALAEKARADLDAADAAIAGIPGESLGQALMSDRAAVQRAYDAVKELTDFLKLEFSMALAITSKRVEGDHD